MKVKKRKVKPIKDSGGLTWELDRYGCVRCLFNGEWLNSGDAIIVMTDERIRIVTKLRKQASR